MNTVCLLEASVNQRLVFDHLTEDPLGETQCHSDNLLDTFKDLCYKGISEVTTSLSDNSGHDSRGLLADGRPLYTKLNRTQSSYSSWATETTCCSYKQKFGFKSLKPR